MTSPAIRTEAKTCSSVLHGDAAVVWVPVAAAASPASPPAVVVVVLVVLPGSSDVGDAMIETGRSWTRG